MKQIEKNFLEQFIANRKQAIENEYKEAVDQASKRADLEAETWLSVHRFEMTWCGFVCCSGSLQSATTV